MALPLGRSLSAGRCTADAPGCSLARSVNALHFSGHQRGVLEQKARPALFNDPEGSPLHRLFTGVESSSSPAESVSRMLAWSSVAK